MELETINKLYLELSQITTATTAREILLQKQLAEAQKDSELERALQQAAKDLPPHFVISVNVERDAGWVQLYGSDGDIMEFALEDLTLAEQVRAAIDAAKGESNA